MRRGGPALVAGLGGVLLVVGLVTFWVTNTRHHTWTVHHGHYGPRRQRGDHVPLVPGDSPYESRLSLSFDGDWTVLWTGGHLVGAGLVVAGLLLLAAFGGWLLGRRTGRGRAG